MCVLDRQKTELKISGAKTDGVMLPFPCPQPRYFIACTIPRDEGENKHLLVPGVVISGVNSLLTIA